MATKEQLIHSMMKKLTKQFDAVTAVSSDNGTLTKETVLNCRNTRVITVIQTVTPDCKTYYGYQFLTVLDETPYTLEQISEKLLLLGYENEDIFGAAPDQFQALGFIPEPGTNYCALSNMIMPDNYVLELDEQVRTNESCEVNGVSYQNTCIKENLTIYGKVVASRNIIIKTEPNVILKTKLVEKGESKS